MQRLPSRMEWLHNSAIIAVQIYQVFIINIIILFQYPNDIPVAKALVTRPLQCEDKVLNPPAAFVLHHSHESLYSDVPFEWFL